MASGNPYPSMKSPFPYKTLYDNPILFEFNLQWQVGFLSHIKLSMTTHILNFKRILTKEFFNLLKILLPSQNHVSLLQI